jgi:predicted dehydrogenase
MKIAVVGGDAEIERLAAAARRRGDVVIDLPDAADGVPAALLDASACDVVAIGTRGWSQARADLVRLLVQAGRTLVVAHPLEPSMLWAYELEMVARDTGAVLVPFLPDRLHPFVGGLAREIQAAVAGEGPRGPLESVRLERTMTVRTQATVLAALARDVDMVRVLVGEPTRLGTLGTADAEATWPTLAVGFTGPALVPVRWQVAPGAAPGLRITLQHARGSLEVIAPDDDDVPWSWSGPPPATAAFDRGATIRDVAAASLSGTSPPLPDAGPPAATWADAARALDLAEAVPRSLARGRAIDLHQEEFSELGTFRGTMASLGCGLVLLALVVLLAATLVGGIASELDWEFGAAVAAAWPAVVLTALLAFLALQVLPLLAGVDRRLPDRPAGRPRPR